MIKPLKLAIRQARNLPQQALSTLTDKFISQSQGEMLIEVDTHNREIGPISKYDAHRAKNIEAGRVHRAFSLFVFDAQNRLLLQKRSRHKVTFARLWTNSCCSHPLWNLSEREADGYLGVRIAAQRRLKFELNIEHQKIDDYKCADAHLYSAIDQKNPDWGEYECKVIS